MAIDPKDLAKLSPQERIKKLKQLEEERKKEGNEIERLIKERNDARTGRDFKKADSIRALLLEEGIVLEDTPRGTVWTVKG